MMVITFIGVWTPKQSAISGETVTIAPNNINRSAAKCIRSIWSPIARCAMGDERAAYAVPIGEPVDAEFYAAIVPGRVSHLPSSPII